MWHQIHALSLPFFSEPLRCNLHFSILNACFLRILSRAGPFLFISSPSKYKKKSQRVVVKSKSCGEVKELWFNAEKVKKLWYYVEFHVRKSQRVVV